MTGGYDFIFTLAALVFLACGILMIIVWLLSKRGEKRTEAAVIEYKTEEENVHDRRPLLSGWPRR